MKFFTYVSAALICAIGLASTGYFVGDGLKHIKTNERYVNVRGLSERTVRADMAHLVIAVSHSGSAPPTIFPLMDDTQQKTIAFLEELGIKESEIQIGQWNSIRTSPEDLKNDHTLPLYTVEGKLDITTPNIDAVQNIYKRINDLREKTAGSIGDVAVEYSFTNIAPLRPAMIAEATKDARNAALQFATDANSQVGSIKNASQGVFQVAAPGQDADDPQSIFKTVRVVTTVDYELKD